MPSTPVIKLQIPTGDNSTEPLWNLQCSQETAIGSDIMYAFEWLIDGIQVMKTSMIRNDMLPSVTQSMLPGDIINNMTVIKQVCVPFLYLILLSLFFFSFNKILSS